jgi:hypothetical protein
VSVGGALVISNSELLTSGVYNVTWMEVRNTNLYGDPDFKSFYNDNSPGLHGRAIFDNITTYDNVCTFHFGQ